MTCDNNVCQCRRLRQLAGSNSRDFQYKRESSGRFHWVYILAMLIVILLAIILSVFLTSVVGRNASVHACPDNTFQCVDDHSCINISLKCDGERHCADGSDEPVLCDPHTYNLYNNIFQKRTDEDANRECSLPNKPEMCECQKETELYCFFVPEKQPVTFFDKIPRNVTSLTVQGLQIKTLSEANFSTMPFLSKLLIIYAKLENIHSGTFKGCPMLTMIDFTGNKLKHFPSDIFPERNNIEELVLRSNQLKTLRSSDLRNLRNLKNLSLEINEISTIEDEAFNWTNLLELRLNQNQIEKIQTKLFTHQESLRTLHLYDNQISEIQSGSFKKLINLKVLTLSTNNLGCLKDGVFEGLYNLTVLALTKNDIVKIEPGVFKPLQSLESLELMGNPFERFPKDSFNQLSNLRYIYFDKFQFCAYVSKAVCEPRSDGISSQENLLENVVLRISVWIMAVLGCIGNMVVLLGRFILKEDNQIHSFFIKNLSLADMLMGIYLLIIGSHDQMYHGNYIQYDEDWRKSWVCDLSGVISTVSSEMSVLTLTVITLDRYICIMYPLSFRRRGLKMEYFIMGITWLIAILLGVIPILGLDYFGPSFYNDNGVCFPLHLHDPHAKGWQYSAMLFIGINSFSFGFITFAYTAMFLSIQKSEINLRTTRESKETCLAKRFFFIVSTDFLCWIPIIIIKITALAGVKLSDDVYAWVIVFILPVNSALNPLLYTLTTKLFKQKLLSKFSTMVWRSRKNNGKEANTTTSCTRGSTMLSRHALNEVELECLKNHCDKDAVKLLKKSAHWQHLPCEDPAPLHPTTYQCEHLYSNKTPANTQSSVVMR